MQTELLKHKFSGNIKSLSVDKDELKQLFKELQECSTEACEFEISEVYKFENDPAQQSVMIENLRACAQLRLTIVGDDGREIFGTADVLFNAPSFPEKVKLIYTASDTPYQSDYKYFVKNYFRLMLDFSKPNVVDFSFLPGDRTLNNSNYEINGTNKAWSNSVFLILDRFIKGKPSKLPFVHKNTVYDLIVWFFALPAGLYYVMGVYAWIGKLTTSTYIKGLTVTYFFIAILMLARIFFHYLRWVYPMVEYRSKNHSYLKHQAAIYSIIISTIGKILYDIFM